MAYCVPNFVDLNITKKCNMACIHCYMGIGNDIELPFEKGKEYISQLSKLGVFQMAIAGGEPLTHPKWFDFLKCILDNDMGAILNTNGVLFKDEDFKKFDALSEEKKEEMVVSISLDGLPKQGYSKIRKWLDGSSAYEAFDVIIKNAKKLREVGIKIVFNFMYSSLNKDDLLPLYDFLIKEFGEKEFVLNLILFGISGKGVENKEKLSLSFEQRRKELINIIKIKDAGGLKRLTIEPSCPWEIYLPLKNYSYEKIEKLLHYKSPLRSHGYKSMRTIGCHGGITNAVVNWDGNIYACGLFPQNSNFLLGNLNDNSIINIWQDSYNLNCIRNMTINDLPDVCQKCNISDICGGGCRGYASLKNNNIYDADDRCPLIGGCYHD